MLMVGAFVDKDALLSSSIRMIMGRVSLSPLAQSLQKGAHDITTQSIRNKYAGRQSYPIRVTQNNYSSRDVSEIIKYLVNRGTYRARRQRFCADCLATTTYQHCQKRLVRKYTLCTKRMT